MTRIFLSSASCRFLMYCMRRSFKKGAFRSSWVQHVNVTYQAMADGTGSINTTSIGKTNFWDHVLALFGVNPPEDVGLQGAKMPGADESCPNPFLGRAGRRIGLLPAGIPITSLDDSFNTNSYPLMNVQALDPANEAVLSSLPVVVPVSNEMACNVCHDTGNDRSQSSRRQLEPESRSLDSVPGKHPDSSRLPKWHKSFQQPAGSLRFLPLFPGAGSGSYRAGGTPSGESEPVPGRSRVSCLADHRNTAQRKCLLLLPSGRE